MEIREITEGAEEIRALERINEEAFTKDQRSPIREMLATGAAVLCIYEGPEPVGFMAVRYFRDMVYLGYFAVRSDLRAKGIGRASLRALISSHPDKQIVTEYEAPDPNSAHSAMQLRRKQFYLQNGFYETEWRTCYDNTEFEVCCSRPDFDSECFMAFSQYLVNVVSEHIPILFPKKPEHRLL